MSERVDLRGIGKEEHCEDVKQVASKVGVQVVCNDEDALEVEKQAADIVMAASKECEDTKEVASKVGVQVVCDDEA